MGVELDAVLADFAQFPERKDLEAAAVGEDGAVPPHEAVQPAAQAHDLVARAEHQVVGVAEEDPHVERAQVARFEGLDGALRADGHEDRGLHVAVGGVQDAAPRVEAASGGGGLEEGEGHGEVKS